MSHRIRSLAKPRVAIAALALAALAAGSILAFSPGASPAADVQLRGKDCSVACSEIQNRAGSNIRVARDWCSSNSKPNVGGPRGCEANTSKHPQQSLKPGEHSYSAAYHDTDSFKVHGGCTMKVQWNWDGEEDAPISTHRPRKDTWYKVYDHHDIDIESYKC